ncbi:MAG: DNA replication/repair protein RecF [Verrucomicrobiales bacterium]|nr:DNA replication/repair protein RecF [Verrucomicrobiales bacterium]
MHLVHLRLRDFRNYARLDVELGPGFHLFIGDNAQGKTNILEAIYLLATLRSFRGVGSAQMVRHGARGYFVGGQWMAEVAHDVKMYWSMRERSLTMDEQPVRRLSEYYGRLRCVVFCTEDLQLVKGASKIRRRFLDLLLAQTQPGYLTALQRYVHALQSRNALLKRPDADPALMAPFTQELITAGSLLMERRRALVPELSTLAKQAYARISLDAEELRLTYAPSVKADFAVELAQAMARERVLRATTVGPHRDDLQMQLNERSAAQFSSEGQKRTLAIALKMAQAEFLTGLTGVPPILLIDDVMGELDARRRAGLMPLLERTEHRRGQVLMTCTQENWPRDLGRSLHRWEVRAAHLRAAAPSPATGESALHG